MQGIENSFFQAINDLSGQMKGYRLNLVKRSDVSTYEGKAPNVIWFDYAVADSSVTVQFSLSMTTGTLLGVRIKNANADTFSIDEYLAKHKMGTISEKLFSNRGDLPLALRTIIDLFNNNMNEIIVGKLWEDIPRDWMGYK